MTPRAEKLLRLLTYATFPLLGLSLLLFAGMMFGAAFVTDFVVINRTNAPIVVTPVGTVGKQGRKSPLPVKMARLLPLPALSSGGYRLAPGQSVTISYDMDDINFSEILVEAAPGQSLQLVTDPHPTSNQYHGPMQRQYVIDDLAQLDQATSPVRAAAEAADRQWIAACVVLSLLFGPWLAYTILMWLSAGRRNRR
jgi:hypothetical protein